MTSSQGSVRPPSPPRNPAPDDPNSSNGGRRVVLPFDLSRIKEAQIPDPDFVDFSSMRLDSDLAELIRNEAVRKRYREGRYVPGKNVSIRLPSYVSWISHTAGSIGHYARVDSGVGMGTVAALAMHIGSMEMLRWESIARLASVGETFNREQPTMSDLNQSMTSEYMRNFQPPQLPRSDKILTIPTFVSDSLANLACRGLFGESASAVVASYAMVLVFANQPSKYVNPEDTREMRKWAIRLETALELKAELLSGLGEKIRSKERTEI